MEHLHHAHLFASDLDASVGFYQEMFAAEVLLDTEMAGARNVMILVGTGRINFYDQPPRDTGRGVVHHLGIETDDLEGAEAHFRSAIVSDREFAEAWNALGRVMEATDRPPDAIEAYSRAVLLEPAFTDARNSLGIVLAETGQYHEAIRELETALGYDPGAENVRSNLEQVRKLLAASRDPRR